MSESNTDRFYRLQQENLQQQSKQAQTSVDEFLQRSEELKRAAEELQRQLQETNQVQNNGQTK